MQAPFFFFTAGVDYTPVTNISLFADLATLRDCVDIVILNDSVLEDTESFEVALSSPDEVVHFTRPTANVYVLDDDGVRMGLMERDYTGYEGDQIEICVELVGMISQDIRVDIQSQPVSARGIYYTYYYVSYRRQQVSLCFAIMSDFSQSFILSIVSTCMLEL